MNTAQVTPAKLDILLTLARFLILTASQICKATRSPKSLKETYRQLQPLIEEKYADYIFTGLPRWGGKPLRAYFLTDKGYRYLKELRLIGPQGYRARAIRSRTQHHFSHTSERN